MLNTMAPDVCDPGAADLRGNQTATAAALVAELRDWLDAFAAAVRAVDYAAGERLFAPDVVGFGTVGVLLCGRDTLMQLQWRRVWGATSGFRDRLPDSATKRRRCILRAWVSPWTP